MPPPGETHSKTIVIIKALVFLPTDNREVHDYSFPSWSFSISTAMGNIAHGKYHWHFQRIFKMSLLHIRTDCDINHYSIVILQQFALFLMPRTVLRHTDLCIDASTGRRIRYASHLQAVQCFYSSSRNRWWSFVQYENNNTGKSVGGARFYISWYKSSFSSLGDAVVIPP